MSDVVKPPIHGRDHRPGGSDPIPGNDNPWARRKLTADQTIPDSADTAITFDTDVNHYTDYYTLALLGGFNAIKVLKPGLYSFLCRVACHTLATEFIIDLNPYDAGAVQTELFSYTQGISTMAAANRQEGFAELTLRMPANAYVGVQIRHNAGTSKTIGNGTFLEARYLGIVTTTDRGW